MISIFLEFLFLFLVCVQAQYVCLLSSYLYDQNDQFIYAYIEYVNVLLNLHLIFLLFSRKIFFLLYCIIRAYLFLYTLPVIIFLGFQNAVQTRYNAI